MKLALLPLDSRPCSFEQTIELATLLGFEVNTGPVTEDFESREVWLNQAAKWSNAVVLSFDQWIYGGLVESRTLSSCTLETGFRRLASLQNIIASNPQTRFYVTSVLLRLALTVTDAASEQHWRDLFRFSVLSDGCANEELREAASKLPKDLLQGYLAVRARNHALSLSLVKGTKESSQLWFGQEDCGPRGLHRKEKLALFEAIRDQKAQERVTVLTGADELVVTSLLSAHRDLIARREIPRLLRYFCAAPGRLSEIGLFEDIPAIENMKLHAQAGGFQLELTQSMDRADFFVQPFLPGGQLDGCFESPPLDSELERIGESIPRGLGILDLSTGNGAHPSLMRGAARTRTLVDLPAFSAWNTVGNRLGTFFAAVALAPQNTGPAVLTRLLDDWIYQAEVRPTLQKEAKKLGINSWKMSEEDTLAFEKRASELANQALEQYGGTLLSSFAGRVRVKLPWRRLFEAHLEVTASI